MGSPSHREYQRLFDYFSIVGLNPDGGLEPNHIQGVSHLVPPLERSYVATVLGHYPDSVPGAPLDHHALQMLCLPKGLQLRTQKQCLDAVYHPFLITREDGSRCYGFSYTFYEEVNATHICTAMHTLQSGYLAEVSSSQGGVGEAPSEHNTTPHKGSDPRRDTRSLPREFRWSSPKSAASRLFYDVTKDQLYVSKCIVLVGRQPDVGAARKFLVGLYKLFTGCESGPVTLESHVHNLLYEVHVPPPGRCLAFSCVGSPHLSYRPTSHELPLLLYPLRELFSLLSPECVVQLLSCVLLENQVLLVANDYYRLMLAAEGICALLFPFVWQHVYVPILPAALTHFLDAPVPFIMGLHASPAAKRNIAIPDEANLCLVDLDIGAVDVPEDLPQFPHGAEFVAELSKLLGQWDLPAPPASQDRYPSSGSDSLVHKHRRRRKYSWSHDSDSGVSSNEGSITGSMSSSVTGSMCSSVTGSMCSSVTGSMSGSMSDSHSSGASLFGSTHRSNRSDRANQLHQHRDSHHHHHQHHQHQHQHQQHHRSHSKTTVPPPLSIFNPSSHSGGGGDGHESNCNGLSSHSPKPQRRLLNGSLNQSDGSPTKSTHHPSSHNHSSHNNNNITHQSSQCPSPSSHNGYHHSTGSLTSTPGVTHQQQHVSSTPPSPNHSSSSSSGLQQTTSSSSQLDHSLLDLSHSSNFRDISAIARKNGKYDKEALKRALISNGFGSSTKEPSNGVLDITPQCPEAKAFLEMLQFNSAVREVFHNRFLQMFCTYDHFIIQPNVQEVDMETWLNNRESLQNFDKATFLSDQPVAHLPFLSRFIESQMFASFIDHKILSFWGEVNNNQRLFDTRIRQLRERYDESVVRTPCYEPCTSIADSANILEKRLSRIDYLVPPPMPMDPLAQSCTLFNPGHFPLLDKIALNKEPSRSKKSRGSWRRRERQAQHLQHMALSQEEKDQALTEAKTMHTPVPTQPKLADMAPALMAQTNWKFVEQLLKECKTRTKRMLVAKMGSEAVELGHQEASLVGVEENTLVASLCHLLERVWAHGLQTKQGKSALWSHLISFQELEENSTAHPDNPNFLSPELSTMALETESAPASPTHSPHPLGGPQSSTAPRKGSSSANNTLRKNSISSGNLYEKGARFISSGSHHNSSSNLSSSHNPLRPSSAESSPNTSSSGQGSGSSCSSLPPLPVSVTFDMKTVMAMSEIKTEIGYARAWLRLSLEKKLLSRHLTTLLGDAELLRSLYKRYAFLRCDDEKEQFLSYLLSLNAVDYYCFTNTYTTTKLSYRVVLFTSRKLSAATTTANAWVSLAGSLGHTAKIPVNKTHHNQIVFQHKNLGLLSTLRLGHDNYGMSPKWLVEHIIVRNELTGHTWKFPCGRWLGRGIDDGSLERILVGEMVPDHVTSDDLIQSCKTPPRCRSPNLSGPRRTDVRLNVGEIQQLLGDAVNNLVKFFYKPEKERGSLTLLLCGDLGLVACLELVFAYGFKSSRFFGKNLYLWDYLERVEQEFRVSLRDEREREELTGLTREPASVTIVKRKAVSLIDKINRKSTHLGKDDKWQLFMCIAAREHLVHRLLLPLHKCTATGQLYEDSAFLRDPQLLRDLINVLAAIADFEIVLEDSLTRGMDE